MSAYDLPTSLQVRGVAYPINYGWKNAIETLCILGNPDIDAAIKTLAMVDKVFGNLETIPPEAVLEAASAAREFLDCGEVPDKTPGPKLMDWEQDAQLIVSAINKEAGFDIRTNPELHWWTVYDWFRNSSGGLWSNVLHIRLKLSRHEELTKEEQRWYKKNAAMVDLKNTETSAIKQAKDELKEFLGGG